MPRVMSLAKSRERAERVVDARARGQSWSQIRDAHGFKSVGAAQNAYKRWMQRNPVMGGEAVRAEIVERARQCIAVLMESLEAAALANDYGAVAALTNAVTKIGAELAKLYGLSREALDLTVRATAGEVIEDAEAKLLALVGGDRAPKVVDGEVLIWTDEDALVRS